MPSALGDERGHLSGPVGHGRQVRGARVSRVGRPAERLHVAGVADLGAAGRQRVAQPRIAHRPRPLLRPGAYAPALVGAPTIVTRLTTAITGDP